MDMHFIELHWIHAIHTLRSAGLDAFFVFLSFFDRPEFYLLLVPIVWAGKGWKSGLRFFYILTLSNLTNHVLKVYFGSPRPFHIDPRVGLIDLDGLGFPSGAAQSAVLLSGMILCSVKGNWKWAIVVPYFVLLSFSRVYLGVHFPTDILAGWVVGLGLFAIWRWLFPFIEGMIEPLRPTLILLLGIAVPGALFLTVYASPPLAASIGAAVGVYLAHQWKVLASESKGVGEFIFRAFIGVAGTVAIYIVLKSIPKTYEPWDILLKLPLLGIWLGLGTQTLLRLFLKPSHNRSH